ncbi:MAG: nitrilase-related carbon-nitrogen hydrolase [Bdellovibrionales bacterium]
MVIIGGTLPRATADGKFLSSAPIVFPDGRVEYQDKIFFTPWEKELEMVRGNELRRLEYDGVSFAVLICFDVEFPRLSQLLAAKPPELLLVPSMTESEAGLRRVRYTAQARAVESHAYVVIAGTVGRTSKSWVQFGQGVFLGPQEKGFPAVLKEGKANREEMVVVELDLKKLRESREKSGYNPSREDKGEPIRMAP